MTQGKRPVGLEMPCTALNRKVVEIEQTHGKQQMRNICFAAGGRPEKARSMALGRFVVPVM
jgi:hypothetical protein